MTAAPAARRRWWGRRSTVVLTTGVVLLAGCTATQDTATQNTDDGTAAPVTGPQLAAPTVTGAGSIATTLPQADTPSEQPTQVADDLAGTALPTSQWWTSALIGPLSQPLWAHPLAVRTSEDAPDGAPGVSVSSQPATVTEDAVVTPFVASLTVPGKPSDLTVTGYGAFDVRFDVAFDESSGGGTLGVTVVQGSPLTWLDFRDGLSSELQVLPGAQLGDPQDVGGRSVTPVLIGESTWDLVAAEGTTWTLDGTALTPSTDVAQLAIAVEPADAPGDWAELVAGAASPVTGTTEALSYDAAAGTVTQTLTTERSDGEGLWALMPHLAAASTGTGTWPDQLGDLTLATGDAVTTAVPMPGLLTAVPELDLDADAAAAVAADLATDLASPGTPGGSYFGGKEMGRLAVLAEVAQSTGDDAARQQALDRLRPLLVDLLTYDGPTDTSFLGYDERWGGIIASPAEFGSQDYNDHHFHYGYVLYAAAVLGAADPSFVTDYGPTVDLLVRDVAGTDAAEGDGGLPAFRVWNAYEGHSAASGFVPFADGNNQESSSEAVAAWEGVVRWGLVSGEQATVEAGVTHYALESASASRYWLGEGLTRPAGFDHTVVGIVWGAKTDYATFFDPAPEAVEGIQLLPIRLGSLYRDDPAAAAARSAGIDAATGGQPRTWGDLFAVDLALSDPTAALARLDAGVPREPSTSAALVRLMTTMLARWGPPQPAVTADGPFGLAFGSADAPTLVGTNPTAEAVTVTFSDGTSLEVPAGGTTVRPGG
ncbi:Endoglucanase Acf2 [Klenkia soli]|uniref:glucan endo-1,3-beta-D-glucosidase n=1 Tax=Klenkia soli TaxID=1052260 RepID=A0A1H0UTU6_9ACTN|nr:glycosyl hydrolase [Klenkia soli]SDP69632.1 Endoglucanase Acf2 [Klenkia soli]